MPKSKIARFIQQQEKLRGKWTLHREQQGTSKKWKHEGKDPDVEETLNQWFSAITGIGVLVSGPVLKSKPES
jgi:hypothetical protein